MSHQLLRGNAEGNKGPTSTDIFNGARCKSYSWSQSHEDIEIRIELTRNTRQDDLSVSLSKREICVQLSHGPALVETLVKGKFEHPVDKESAFWVVEKESSCLVIYIDKAQEMWWKRVLTDEEATEVGPRNYTVPMDHLDSGSRMVIDKLITDQKKKRLIPSEDQLSLA